MAEYIFEIKNAVYNGVTGEVSVKPKCVGELIRCKDCKYWTKPYGWNGFCDHGIPAEADDFCSWAERKEK